MAPIGWSNMTARRCMVERGEAADAGNLHGIGACSARDSFCIVRAYPNRCGPKAGKWACTVRSCGSILGSGPPASMSSRATGLYAMTVTFQRTTWIFRVFRLESVPARREGMYGSPPQRSRALTCEFNQSAFPDFGASGLRHISSKWEAIS